MYELAVTTDMSIVGERLLGTCVVLDIKKERLKLLTDGVVYWQNKSLVRLEKLCGKGN